MTVQSINYRGRKGKIGSVCFNNQGMAFFAGYNSCNQCGNRGRVLLSIEEAREFAGRVGGNARRESIGLKLTKKLNEYYNI